MKRTAMQMRLIYEEKWTAEINDNGTCSVYPVVAEINETKFFTVARRCHYSYTVNTRLFSLYNSDVARVPKILKKCQQKRKKKCPINWRRRTQPMMNF